MKTRRQNLARRLAGGDRRSLGETSEVVDAVLKDPSQFEAIFTAMLDDDPVVRMRAADATEKVSRIRPELLAPFKGQLFDQVAFVDQQEVQWHVAQMLGRMSLSVGERSEAVDILVGYLGKKSSILRTLALQTLADFAERDPSLEDIVMGLLETALATGTPAMKSRARKLLERLRKSRETQGKRK